MTVIKLLMLLAVAIVGFCYSNWDNPSGWPYNHWNPFLVPAWDVDGLFVGASVLFFGYTGGVGWVAVGPPQGRGDPCTSAAGSSWVAFRPSLPGRSPTPCPTTAGFDAIGNAAEEVSSRMTVAVRHGLWHGAAAWRLRARDAGCCASPSCRRQSSSTSACGCRLRLPTTPRTPGSLVPPGSQVQNVRHLPPAIVGTVLVSIFCYLLLALALVLLVYPNIACPACNIVGSSSPPLVTFISAFSNGHGARVLGLQGGATVQGVVVAGIAFGSQHNWLGRIKLAAPALSSRCNSRDGGC